MRVSKSRLVIIFFVIFALFAVYQFVSYRNQPSVYFPNKIKSEPETSYWVGSYFMYNFASQNNEVFDLTTPEKHQELATIFLENPASECINNPKIIGGGDADGKMDFLIICHPQVVLNGLSFEKIDRYPYWQITNWDCFVLDGSSVCGE